MSRHDLANAQSNGMHLSMAGHVFCAVLSVLVVMLFLVPLPAQARTLSIAPADGNEDATYAAYKVFSGDASSDGITLQNIDWASANVRDAVVPVLRSNGATNADVVTAQQAAEYINQNIDFGNATDSSTILEPDSMGAKIASALQTSGATPIKFNGGASSGANVEPGWYLVVSGEGSKASTSPVFAMVSGSDVTINEKTSVPTVQKTVNGGSASSSNVGEPLSFEAVGTVSENVAGFDTYRYVFEDTPTNLDIDMSTVSVSLVNGTAPVVVKPDILQLEASGKLEVGFSDLKATASNAGTSITPATKVVLTYKASLAPGAVVGAKGNPNEVKVAYSNNPLASGTGETVPSKTVSYCCGVRIVKRDAGNAHTLSGAGFTIQAQDGGYVQLDGSLASSPYEFKTGDDGTFSVAGLGAGTYTVVETTAPSGYKKAESFTLEISDNAASIMGDTDYTLTATVEGSAASLESVDASGGQIRIDVDDKAIPPSGNTPGKQSGGSWLPKTGDKLWPGLVAIGLLVASIVFMVRARRRMADEDSGA